MPSRQRGLSGAHVLADGGHLVRVDVAGAWQAWAAALGGAGPGARNAHGGPAALNSHIPGFCALCLGGLSGGKVLLLPLKVLCDVSYLMMVRFSAPARDTIL